MPGVVAGKAELDLVADIYDAAIQPELWPTVLATMASVGDAEMVVLTATDMLDLSYNMTSMHGISPEVMTVYRDQGIYALEMEFMGGQWMSQYELGVPSASNIHFGGPEHFRNAGGKYVEFANDVAGIFHQAPIIFERTEYRICGIGLNNRLSRPFTEKHLGFLRRISPHMRRALQIHRQMTSVKLENAGLYAVLDSMAAGVFLLDQRARIVHANPAAQAHLKSPIISIRGNGGLVASHIAQNEQLHVLIKDSIDTSRRDSRGKAGGVITLSDDTGKILLLTVVPLSELSGYENLARDSVAAAVFLTDPARGHTLSQRLLKESLGLTEREAEICQYFVNAPALEQVAEQAGLTVSSVRTYMRDIYQKTGKASQAELMRLLMGLKINFDHIQG